MVGEQAGENHVQSAKTLLLHYAMKRQYSSRVVPLSVITAIIFGVLLALQVFIVAGGLEVKAATVKKVLPNFYGSFLKLTGEHPDAQAHWYGLEEKKPNDAERATDPALVAGFAPDRLNVIIEGSLPVPTNLIINPSIPVEKEGGITPDDLPEAVDEVVPVG
ncbi:MAG TPA: hypothetical protein VIR63_07230 [Pontiella sp.]